MFFCGFFIIYLVSEKTIISFSTQNVLFVTLYQLMILFDILTQLLRISELLSPLKYNFEGIFNKLDPEVKDAEMNVEKTINLSIL